MPNDTRSPDFILKIKTASGRTARVGAAWKNTRGHLNVQINPGVVLDWRSLEGCFLTLFPNDEANLTSCP